MLQLPLETPKSLAGFNGQHIHSYASVHLQLKDGMISGCIVMERHYVGDSIPWYSEHRKFLHGRKGPFLPGAYLQSCYQFLPIIFDMGQRQYWPNKGSLFSTAKGLPNKQQPLSQMS